MFRSSRDGNQAIAMQISERVANSRTLSEPQEALTTASVEAKGAQICAPLTELRSDELKTRWHAEDAVVDLQRAISLDDAKSSRRFLHLAPRALPGI